MSPLAGRPDEKKVGTHETVQSGLEHDCIETQVAALAEVPGRGGGAVASHDLKSDVSQKGIGKAPTQHGPNLGNFARRSQAIEAGCKRLPQGRWDCLLDPLVTALKKQTRNLLDE